MCGQFWRQPKKIDFSKNLVCVAQTTYTPVVLGGEHDAAIRFLRRLRKKSIFWIFFDFL